MISGQRNSCPCHWVRWRSSQDPVSLRPEGLVSSDPGGGLYSGQQPGKVLKDQPILMTVFLRVSFSCWKKWCLSLLPQSVPFSLHAVNLQHLRQVPGYLTGRNTLPLTEHHLVRVSFSQHLTHMVSFTPAKSPTELLLLSPFTGGERKPLSLSARRIAR